MSRTSGLDIDRQPGISFSREGRDRRLARKSKFFSPSGGHICGFNVHRKKNIQMKVPNKGKLIVGMGLPCSGKSSIFKNVAKALNARVFLEPEEASWPDAVNKRDEVGYISALTWFRAIRIPMLYDADRLRDEGSSSFVDSYYDKLIHLYIDKPGFEWLVPPNDPYMAAYKKIAMLDYRFLPNADCVILFRVKKEKWRHLISKRGRELDRKAGLLNTFHTQKAFILASKQYCHENKATYIEFQNDFRNVKSATDGLLLKLMKKRIFK